MEKNIKKIPVKSSNLDWIGYDKDSKELYVGFKNGSEYVYYDVPESVFEEFKTAGSFGRYHAIKIKYNFKYKRLDK